MWGMVTSLAVFFMTKVAFSENRESSKRRNLQHDL